MEGFNHISFRKNWEFTSKTLYYLGQINATIRAISITPLLPDYHQKLLSVSLQKGAQATTAIEGNTLSEEEIKKISSGISLPPSKEYQGIEVKNILDAFEKIREDIIFNEKSDLISSDLIKSFNYYIGKDLGDHFQGIPGKFRTHDVTVGSYRPPNHTYVPELIDNLCEFLKREFHYTQGQNFGQSVIQSIITHVYIEWIHPFGDGNGRTGRLLEFYLLMRAGNPDIASHILSNHYNDTRSEYYRQLDMAGKSGNLTGFLEYALEGFRDGLFSTLNIIQHNLLTISWQKLVYDVFSEMKYRIPEVFKRKRRVLLNMPIDKELTSDEIFFQNAELAKLYGQANERTLRRELDEFVELKLLVKSGNKYRANTDLLMMQSPLRKLSHNIYDGI